MRHKLRNNFCFVGKALLVASLLLPLGAMFLITKGLIWLCDKALTKRK